MSDPARKTPEAPEAPETAAVTARRRRFAVLARTPLDEIERLWRILGPVPAHTFLRQPETGLAMVRARAGGDGARFNAGEMTLTRCVVRLDSGETGVGYAQGRSSRHAELIALADALATHSARAALLESTVVAPLADRLARLDREAHLRASASRVEFFTLQREAGAPGEEIAA
jgi:alpha-D-ribose 1-methylphosphonate 5-triphosphate synthase subunit PhnG